MRIDRITVENFKGFERREFRFHPQVNLITGKNGSGKTSLLDALAVATGAWFLGLRGPDARHIHQHEVRVRPIELKHAGTTGANASRVNWEEQYPCAIEAAGEVLGKPQTWKRTLNTRNGRTTFVEAKAIKQLASEADADVRAGRPVLLPLISYYGTGRLWDVPREQARVKKARLVIQRRQRLEGYLNSVDPRLSVARLTRWIASESWIAFQQGGAVSPVYEAVRRAILRCVDQARDLYFDPRRGEVVVEIHGQGLQPFNNLSDGQRTMLALVGDIAQKAATLNEEHAADVLAVTPGVVLIDELDLHLHPEWQRSIIESLRTTFPNVQFFATTHSPFLIQSLRAGEEWLSLDGAPPAQLGNKTLEEIAHWLMGVQAPETSARYEEMKNTATAYLETLDKATAAPPEKLARLEQRLAESIAPYADNPAYQAFLEMKRAAKLGR
ncbi:MAG: AAA family ATPase [Bryobacteraceae bacterium]